MLTELCLKVLQVKTCSSLKSKWARSKSCLHSSNEGTLNNNTNLAAGDSETSNQATTIITASASEVKKNCERVVC